MIKKNYVLNKFNKGLIYTILASLWWGILGVIYFRSLSFVGYTELVLHRVIWTFVILLIVTSLFSKWKKLKKIIKLKNNLFFLCISGILIFSNWSVWIYAVSINKIVDASFGYFIMPILSVMLGYLFFKEKLNKKRIFSIFLMLLIFSQILYFSCFSYFFSFSFFPIY